jgi:adenine deaminase
MSMRDVIAVARGDAPADLLLTNAKIVNTFTSSVEEGDVAICGGRIAGIGDYSRGKEVLDLEGRYLSPALIDGHVHPESSMLHIARYAQVAVPRGLCALVTDFHAIANVKGLRGVKHMLDCAETLPLDLFLMVPSCVPATRLETSGARITADDIELALSWHNTVGLGEVMNFSGVVSADEATLRELASAAGKVIDGHAPGLTGKELNAYIAAGILSDHESTTIEEAREKLQRGMHLMIREGSSEKNLEALLPLVTDRTHQRCLLVVDDRTCDDLVSDGDVDGVVRKAVRLGSDPIRAIQLATINPAVYFRLQGLGAIAPGYFANLIVFRDLDSLVPEQVFYRGKVVAEKGRALFSPSIAEDDEITHTMHIRAFAIESLRLPSDAGSSKIIQIVPDQIVTKKAEERVRVENGEVMCDTERDILKLVVVERHKATGNIGIGLVRGFGLKKGAAGSSFAHDSHNIVVVGTNDRDICITIKEIERLQGGLAVAADGEILGALALPVAGIMSSEAPEIVANSLQRLNAAALGLGCNLARPFATLSLLALPVVPELRLTDFGLVDSAACRLVGDRTL